MVLVVLKNFYIQVFLKSLGWMEDDSHLYQFKQHHLSIMHIKILKSYIDREIVFKNENRQDNQCLTSLHSVCQKTSLTESQAEAFCNDLVRYDLLYDSMIGKYDYKRNHFRITNHAIEFMNFIEMRK